LPNRFYPLACFALTLCASCASTHPGAKNASTHTLPTKPTTPGKNYPALTTSTDIDDAYAHPDVWNGAAIATQGKIGLMREDPGGQTVLELEIDSPVTTIWADFTTQLPVGFVHPGNIVRVVGWLLRTEEFKTRTHSIVPNDNPLTLYAICIVKLSNKEQIFDMHFLQHCETWRNGKLPPDLVDVKP
jgi:hypothetical protein